jgi:hypothetical protein
MQGKSHSFNSQDRLAGIHKLVARRTLEKTDAEGKSTKTRIDDAAQGTPKPKTPMNTRRYKINAKKTEANTSR